MILVTVTSPYGYRVQYINLIHYNMKAWNDYEEKVTQEQFDKFVNTVDKNKLPKNITFKLK